MWVFFLKNIILHTQFTCVQIQRHTPNTSQWRYAVTVQTRASTQQQWRMRFTHRVRIHTLRVREGYLRPNFFLHFVLSFSFSPRSMGRSHRLPYNSLPSSVIYLSTTPTLYIIYTPSPSSDSMDSPSSCCWRSTLLSTSVVGGLCRGPIQRSVGPRINSLAPR